MSRARDLANLGDGITASDVPNLAGDKITSGTLSNTVQDNITRLGIVTTGTMKNTIHSDTTFPAGHIIQIKFDTSATQSSGNGWQTAISNSITMSSDSNKLLCIATISVQVGSTSNTVNYGGIKLVSSGTGVSAETYESTKRDNTGSYGLTFTAPTSGDWNRGWPASIIYEFSPSESTNATTITAYAGGRDTAAQGNVTVNADGTVSNSSQMILMEIQQ